MSKPKTVEIKVGTLTLKICNESPYDENAAQLSRVYGREFSFCKEFRASSRHGLVCDDQIGPRHSCLLLAGGGASGVHDNSALVVDGICFVAVGDMICSLSLPKLELKWATKVDSATCFGVYYSPRHNCVISHGEMEIARISLVGDVDWSGGGMDIFSEGFRVDGDHVEAIDFNHQVYRFDIETGRSEMVDSKI